MKYLIASGWWSCLPSEDEREHLKGSDDIRDPEFYKLWKKCIYNFSSPSEVLVVDSSSPIKPTDSAGEKWLEMYKNFGHSTSHEGGYSGYTRAIFISMMYAYANDFDYWVYVEQDVLIYGANFIESIIDSDPSESVFYGGGEGTPQVIQQSLMVFHRDAIIPFIKRYTKIGAADRVISPEWKFYFSQNKLARILPDSFLEFLARNKSGSLARMLQGAAKKLFLPFMWFFDDFSKIPFGYGRTRPINFGDAHFYFQHASEDELREMKELIN